MGKRSGLYTAQQFIDAIPGTGGIISAIARKVGCDWKTADKYVREMPTIQAAYEAERQAQLDIAESVVYGNINLALKQVQSGEMTDTSDAKWFLSKRGKDRGYTDRQELTGPDGGPIEIKEVRVKLDTVSD